MRIDRKTDRENVIRQQLQRINASEEQNTTESFTQLDPSCPHPYSRFSEKMIAWWDESLGWKSSGDAGGCLVCRYLCKSSPQSLTCLVVWLVFRCRSCFLTLKPRDILLSFLSLEHVISIFISNKIAQTWLYFERNKKDFTWKMQSKAAEKNVLNLWVKKKLLLLDSSIDARKEYRRQNRQRNEE